MYKQVVAGDLSRAQFDAARLGFFQLLRRKRMSPQFVDRHGEDLFGQACFEYSRQLAEGKKIGKPAAWIITCGWHRTVGLLETRDWRPQMVSTERAGELGAEDGDEPEGAFLSEDRYRKVRDAVERLPDYQRRLLALSYFEEKSVREAARELGWTPSKAQRAHEAAQRRLHKLLRVESSDELAIEVGMAAFLTIAGGGCARHLQLFGGIEGAIDHVTHRAVRLGERALDLIRGPFNHAPTATPRNQVDAIAAPGTPVTRGGDHRPVALVARGVRRVSQAGRRLVANGALETTGAAVEGGGRAAEACKVALAVCLVGGSAVTGALLTSTHHLQQTHHRHRPVAVERPRHPAAIVDPSDRVAAASPAAASNATGDPTAPTTAAPPQPEARATVATRSAAQTAASRPARQAERRPDEEAETEQSFGAIAVATKEEEAFNGGNAVTSSTEADSTTSASQPGSSGSDATGPSASKEENVVHGQFREGALR